MPHTCSVLIQKHACPARVDSRLSRASRLPGHPASPMSGSSFAPILLNSFKVIASLFLQYAVGALVAWAGVIKEGDMRAFSAVMNAVLIPVPPGLSSVPPR